MSTLKGFNIKLRINYDDQDRLFSFIEFMGLYGNEGVNNGLFSISGTKDEQETQGPNCTDEVAYRATKCR